MRLLFSPTAADLEEIGDLIAQDNPVRALSFLQELHAHCARLTRHPGIGTARPAFGDGLRVMPHSRYLIFYREHGALLRVECILHGARNIGRGDLTPGDEKPQALLQARDPMLGYRVGDVRRVRRDGQLFLDGR